MRRGKASLQSFYLLSFLRNGILTDSGQGNQAEKLMRIWHMSKPVHGKHLSSGFRSMFKLWDSQQNWSSLSNPISPMFSSLPSQHGHIAESFGDIPPAKHHSKSQGCCQQTSGAVGTLCRTKDREKSTLPAELSTHYSQVSKSQSQKNWEKQNKPHFSSFSFIFPPQEVKGYG